MNLIPALDIHEKAEQAKKSFLKNSGMQKAIIYMITLMNSGNEDESLRPNQVFAISLPFHLIEGEKAEAVINIVSSKLLTTVGLRSLSPDDPGYKGSYGGDAFTRDSAYHQGTVWSWLLGPYLEAGMKIFGDKFQAEAIAAIAGFSFHLTEACVGNVSEIFDGDAPHHPRGCVAQAWGVAEILRVIKTYSLFQSGQLIGVDG